MFDLIELNIIKILISNYPRPEDKRIIALMRKVNKLIREYRILEPVTNKEREAL